MNFRTPIKPGGMTPAQMVQRMATFAAMVIITAATVAAMFATIIIFN